MKKIFTLIAFITTINCEAQVNWIGYLPVIGSDTIYEVDKVVLDTNGLPTIIGGVSNYIHAYIYDFNGTQWHLLDSSLDFGSGGIVYDQSNNLWAGDYGNNQICKIVNSIIVDTFSCPFLSIGAGFDNFKFDTNGKLWGFAYDPHPYASVFNFDGSSWNIFTQSQIGNQVNDILKDFVIDKNNNVYVISDTSGMFIYDGTNWNIVNSSNSNLPPNIYLTAIAIDTLKNIWITATDTNYTKYLLKYNSGNFTSFNSNIYPVLKELFPSFVLVDMINNIWIGDFEQRLVKFNGSYFQLYKDYIGIALDQVNSIAINSKNDIWIVGDGWGSEVSTTVFNEIGFQNITGTVFDDVNQNGIIDSAETGIPNDIISTIYNNYTFCNTNGNYSIGYLDSTVSITINHQPKPYRIATTPTSVSTVPMMNSKIDFGIYTIPNVHDARVCSYLDRIRPGVIMEGFVDYNNIGTASLGDTITVVFDSLLQFIASSPGQTSISGNVIKYAYSNFNPGNNELIEILFDVPTTAQLGDTVYFTSTINPIATDTTPLDNISTTYRIISNSFDPNEKEVQTEWNGINGTIAPSEYLTYTIHFQNTGTDTAYNIIVMDTLDNDLDISTFDLQAYSHPVITELKGAGILQFRFANIMLPDSGTNQALSNGFVRYRIKPKSFLNNGTHLTNKADIYFDFNLPVETNTTVNIIQVNGLNENKNAGFNIYPNPTNDILNFEFTELMNKNIEVEIYSVEGLRILNEQKTLSQQNKLQLNVSKLSPGFYIVKIISGENQLNGSFVKMK